MQPLDWETGKDEHVTEEGCSMIEGAIFDMDGLMFDTEPIWTRTWEPVLATIGIEYPEGLADAVRGTSGKSMEAIINRYAPEADATYVREKAYLVFGIAGAGGEHLQVLANVARALEDEEVVERMRTTTDVDWLLQILS